MLFFKKNNQKRGPIYFEEEPVDDRFNVLADFVKDLDSKADFNKAVGAMELIFNAYQKLRGIKTDDDTVNESDYILHDKEVE